MVDKVLGLDNGRLKTIPLASGVLAVSGVSDIASGVQQLNEVDFATESTASELLQQFNSDFSRLLEKRYFDTEEVRYDFPADLTSTSFYIGVATDGSATSGAVWTVIRYYTDGNKNPNRCRIRQNVAWDDRATGWS